MSVTIAVIGECMLELRQLKGATNTSTKPMDMSYGGDTLNTSVYLARNNISVNYVTALGDDPLSHWLIGEWQKEGIDCDLVVQMPNSVPGMYMIDVDEDGERSFFYWRKQSPASRLFDDQNQVAELFAKLANFSYLYLSGISLAILPEESLARLFDFLSSYRKGGGKIIFDGNYRPNLWGSPELAQQAYNNIYQLTDIALPTLEDEAMLYGFETAEQVLEAIHSHGVKEVVVKMGGEGCLAFSDTMTEFVAAQPTNPIDTTAAGDSFNAGYLGQRVNGSNVVDACRAGHGLASKVIQHRGAIIPKK